MVAFFVICIPIWMDWGETDGEDMESMQHQCQTMRTDHHSATNLTIPPALYLQLHPNLTIPPAKRAGSSSITFLDICGSRSFLKF